MNITLNCDCIFWSATAIDTFKEYMSKINVMAESESGCRDNGSLSSSTEYQTQMGLECCGK